MAQVVANILKALAMLSALKKSTVNEKIKSENKIPSSN